MPQIPRIQCLTRGGKYITIALEEGNIHSLGDGQLLPIMSMGVIALGGVFYNKKMLSIYKDAQSLANFSICTVREPAGADLEFSTGGFFSLFYP